jgi:hypothetical protein
MTVLIGTPIRDIKEYSIREWLNSVSKLKGDWFLFMVDNSDTVDFSERVHRYCYEIGLKNYELIHLEGMGGRESEERLSYSREEIRNRLDDYDYWLSWECDIVLPPDALNILLTFMDGFDNVNHGYPDREKSSMEVGGVGCSLFKKEILKDFTFLNGYAFCDPDDKQNYYSGDCWLITWLLRGGFKMAELHNILKIRHLCQK